MLPSCFKQKDAIFFKMIIYYIHILCKTENIIKKFYLLQVDTTTG